MKKLAHAMAAAYQWGRDGTRSQEDMLDAAIEYASTTWPKSDVYDLCALAYDCAHKRLPIGTQRFALYTKLMYLEMAVDDPSEFWQLVVKTIDK